MAELRGPGLLLSQECAKSETADAAEENLSPKFH